MKNFIILLLTILGLLILNDAYFEYIVSREIHFFISGVSTIILIILDGLGLWVVIKKIQQLLNIN